MSEPETDWQERFFAMEVSHAQKFQRLRDQIKYMREREAIRKEVHRDDILRTAILIAGLKRIQEMGGEAGQIAEDALYGAWGATKVTQHCDYHTSYRPRCRECRSRNQLAPVPEIMDE